jgi:DNA (cytosine-5)-methyltransferase 1
MCAKLRSRRCPVAVPRHIDARTWAETLGRKAAIEVRSSELLGNAIADGPIDVVDLFCGCGGLSTGFEYVGRQVSSYRLAGAVDIDGPSVATYKANLGLAPIVADLANVATSSANVADLISQMNLRRNAPRILLGGPPCQGFSAHQKKLGHKDDSRNRLVLAFARFVELLKPEFVVFENVPEVFAKKFWHHYAEVKSLLESLGYCVRAHIHDLAGFAVPQHRFRAVVCASKKRIAMPHAFLTPDAYVTVRGAIEHLPAVQPGERDGADPMHYCTRHTKSTIQTIKQVPKNGGRRPPGVGPRCLQNVDGFRDVYGRMFWDRPANTITAYSRNPASGRYVHPSQNRGLTIREAAALQGFPKDYVFEGPFDDRFSQIGNAVPPPFSCYLAAHLLGEWLSSSSSMPAQTGSGLEVTEPTTNSFSSGIAGRKKTAMAGRYA